MGVAPRVLCFGDSLTAGYWRDGRFVCVELFACV